MPLYVFDDMRLHGTSGLRRDYAPFDQYFPDPIPLALGDAKQTAAWQASVTVALIGCCYGRHRRPVARSNWLLWPTQQAKTTL